MKTQTGPFMPSQSFRSRPLFLAVAGVVLATGTLGLAAAPARAASLTTLATFNGDNGALPFAGLIADQSGNLYGTTSGGGAFDLGTVFKLTPDGTLATLVSFSGPFSIAGNDGSGPLAGLIADAMGNLYGTTNSGGAGNFGTVFRLTPGGALTTLASLNDSHGDGPGKLIADAAGNLYGTTFFGGLNSHGVTTGLGTVFKLTPDNTLSTLALFNGTNGANPVAGLVADASGNLYGMTFDGGVGSNGGTVFKLTPDGTLTTLVTFNGLNGYFPEAGLIADAAGNLYGTTRDGGAFGLGTVFKLTPDGALATLASFNGFNGTGPEAELIADAAGNLYGTTAGGGAGGSDGTVFKLTPDGTLSTLAMFTGENGAEPFAGLIADAAGNLYGTTNRGGANFVGTVFKLTDTGFVVPEPASLALVVMSLLATTATTRRSRR